MSGAEIVGLIAAGVAFAVVWIALIRASMRNGCRSGSCRIAEPEEEAKKDD